MVRSPVSQSFLPLPGLLCFSVVFPALRVPGDSPPFPALQQTPALKDIAAAIKVSGISKIDLSMEEVKLIVNTLVYDGELEEVRGAASRFSRGVSENVVEKE